MKKTTTTTTQLGRWAGVTPRRVGQILAASKIKPHSRGAWPLDKSLEALFAFYKTAADGPSGLLALRERKLEEQIRLLVLERESKERELVPAELVSRVWSGCMSDLAQRIGFLQIPTREKQDILENLRSIPIDDYFTDAAPVGEDDEPR